jgi:phosphoserine phosphatase
MTFVLTLVAPELSKQAVEAARGALEGAGGADWLSEREACDLHFSGPDPLTAEQRVRAALDATRLDLLAQPVAGRRKALLLADMESTIIEQEMLEELAESLGLRREITEITERTMRGELDFEASLRRRVAMLEGLPAVRLEEAAERMTFSPGARTLVATLKAHGVRCALVSGGFTVFTEMVAQAAGFHEQQANRLELGEGHLTGRLIEPVLGRAAKRQALERLCGEMGIAPEAACAVGDGANDLEMLDIAGLGVAWRAKPALRERARARIDYSDLRAILFFQGYRADEIVTKAH